MHFWDGVAWVNSSRTQMTYDTKNRLLQRLSSSWIGGQWINGFKGDYLYGINDNLNTYTSQRWNGSEWENSRRDIYEWTDNNQTHLLSQTWWSNQWFNLSDDSYVYDSFDNKLETIWRNWNNNDWENYYRFQYAWERITEVNESEINIISNYNLEQNYPNPFNPSTTIKYSIPENSLVKIDIINTLGQRVDILFDDIISVGNHEVIWNALDLPSGLYIYRLSAISLETSKEFQSVKKMILIK